MKIVHIAPNAPYNEGWGYQENLLPKYHQKLGHEVTLLITNKTHFEGKLVDVECCDKILDDGVRLIRLKKKEYIHPKLTNLNSRLEVFHLLKELMPDFIFFHGVVSTSIYDVVKYKKKINPNCRIVCDNHLDKNNCKLNEKSLKGVIFRAFHSIHNKKALKYVERFYGVTPWRKTYLEETFNIPNDKTDVLIMGADDEKICFENKAIIREKIRQEYGIAKTDFLIVTGGKIDAEKNITLLMKACSRLESVRLLIFGDVKSEVKEEFEQLLKESSNINYVGWISADKVYDYFFASDLVVFPGGHSVLWEQACASKVPCLFKYWEGMEHLNNGGNSGFIKDVTVDSLVDEVKSLLFTEKYKKMKGVAESKNTNVYLYSEIAKKSLER